MKSFIFPIAVLAYFFSSSLFAQDVYADALSLKPNLDNGARVYRLCAACHLQDGLGKKNGSFPVIASQHSSVIIKQLKDIQKKYRKNPTMYPFSDPATIGGAQAMTDVAAYIQHLPGHNDNGVGTGKRLKEGRALYLNNCAACHGLRGQGNAMNIFPKIKDQHYEYLLRQLKWIRDGYRINGDPGMLILIKNMSDQDLADLADYASRF